MGKYIKPIVWILKGISAIIDAIRGKRK